MKDLIQKAEQFVFNLFKDKLNPNYTYHNFLHSQFVVTKTYELIAAEGVTEKEADLLVLAAWFHDTGYIDGYENHEVRSVEIAEKFLLENGAESSDIELVKDLILITNLNTVPQTHLE
ncbi:MAG: HD domain-containing protein, partial [Weeksellaceae bacterium]|nr:HD domain-containing protein [Weeksellaceae bacterium]